jgi:hypothetical protein
VKNTEPLSHKLRYVRMIVLLSFILAISAKPPTPITHSAELTPNSPTALPLLSSTFFGGAGDQRGTGISIAAGAIYVSGLTDANSSDGLVARYAIPLLAGAAPVWSDTWPTLTSYDDFNGIGVSSEGVYVAGQSFNRTTDTVGGKEGKGITVKYPLTGPPGGGFDGAIWDAQSPGPPAAFPYGGGEGLNAATVAIEGGLPYVYVTGNSQSGFFNGCRLYVSKLDAAGTVLWTQTDAAANPCSRGLAITTLNGNVYIAGHNDDAGNQVYLVKYAPTGGPATWTRKSITFNGNNYGITAFGGAIYAFGERTGGVGGSSDFLIEKWDEAGVLQWSRQFDRGSQEDILYAGVGLGTRVYAVGSTITGSAGGRDIVLIELDPANGDVKSTTLFGGAQDDIAKGATTDGTLIYVVGESRSFASLAGNVVGQNDLALLSFGGGPTAAPAAISGTVLAADGAPLAGVTLRLSGAVSATAITDTNGRYRFNNVATGNFYTVTPELANHHFSPANRSFSLVGNKTDAAFTASADAVVTANAIDTAEYFVRQHYLDFLGREPEAGGFNYWSEQVNACNGDADCIRTRRIDISAAFFMSQEFKDTGSFVYRLYKGALGRQLRYSEFAADRAQVVGGPNIEASKTAFADTFVQRAEFADKYQGQTTAESFVDALLQTMNDSAGVNLSSERAALISRYNEGASMNASRALLVRQLVDNATFADAVYNQSFVTMQYFGYLRRTPETEGYDFWLNVMNNDPGNYRGMVCSFITSVEYQRRFSVVVSHSNSECGQ